MTLTGIVASSEEVLTAPLSGVPCIAHRSVANAYAGEIRGRRANHPARRVANVHVRTKMIPFVLVTAQGNVIVDGDHAELAMRPRPLVPRDLEREAEFLRGFDDHTHPTNADFEETSIVIGAKITVHGVARVEVIAHGNAETNYRDAPTRFRIVADHSRGLTIAEA